MGSCQTTANMPIDIVPKIKHGYTTMKEQKAKASRLCLTNYVMKKTL